MVHSMTFNSVYLDSSSYELTVLDSQFGYSSAPIIDIQTVPFGPGVSQKGFYSPKEFKISCIVEGSSRTDCENKLNNLSALFAQEEEKSLKFDDYRSGYYWNVRYMGGLENVSFPNPQTAYFDLNFIAVNPLGYSNTQYDSTSTLDSTSFNFSVVNGGNYYAYPIFTFEFGSNNNGFHLTNTSTNETYYYNWNIVAGHVVRINSETMFTEISTDGGSSFGSSMYASGGIYPRLLGNVTNNFTITNVSTSGTITVSWRYRIL